MRKTEPFLVALTVKYLNNGACKMNLLEQFLMKKAELSKAEASRAIHNLLEDGIIVKLPENKKGRKPNYENHSFRLFSEEEIRVSDQDHYCFECYLPGELLKCARCTRVFHSSCIRKRPERPNYFMPSANVIAEYEDESDSEVSRNSVSQGRRSSLRESLHVSSANTSPSVNVSTTPIGRPCRVVLEDILSPTVGFAKLKTEIEDKAHIEQKLEHPDVICMGEVRPPTRQRANIRAISNSLKNESIFSGNNLQTSDKLCTCCRLLETGQLTQPPDLVIDEMHHLLSYGLKRARSWMKLEKNSHMDYLKMPLVIKMLFHREPMTLEMIDEKIKKQKYKLLVDILIDFLECQFMIGVLLGRESLKFDHSKYAVRELLYEIAEIKRCPDCYRHSNERLTPFWFALPCVQRHELVFAKCTGHSYWPAKVVRVLQNGTKYDVRFFGGNHERSLVDSANIRPIDALNITFPKLVSFKKAMDELQCYQTLSEHPQESFRHGVGKDDLLRIIENVMGAIVVDYEKALNSANTTKAPRRNIRNLPHPLLTLTSENEADSEACSSSRAVQNLKRTRSQKLPPKLRRVEKSSSVNSPTTVISTPTPIIPASNTTSITIEQHLAEMNGLRDHLNQLHQRELDNLREQLCELHQRELAIAKQKSYCVKCLQPAKFLCCIHAWYCSKVCQRQHWYEGHDKQCINCTTPTNGS